MPDTQKEIEQADELLVPLCEEAEKGLGEISTSLRTFMDLAYIEAELAGFRTVVFSNQES